MQGYEVRRTNPRAWPPPEGLPHQTPVVPPGIATHFVVPPVRGIHVAPHIETGPIKQEMTGPGATSPLAPSRFQPYSRTHPPHPFHPRKKLDITAEDIDRYLYGKQEMKIVQINDQPPPKIASSNSLKGGSSSKTSPSVNGTNTGTSGNKEDKNKPAKWCDMCQEIRFGECPKHGPLPTSQRPSTTLYGPKSYAVSTFPDEVGLCISTLPMAGYGVFARQFIPTGTWIGPYEGKKISVEEGMKQISQGDAPFLWEIYENYRLVHFLDASDENTSSWMRFIQCARHRGEQNLFVFQYYGSIYYRAFKDIAAGEELLLWYDEKYQQHMGIPISICDMSSYALDGRCGPVHGDAAKAAEMEAGVLHPHPGHPDHPLHHPGIQLIQTNGKVIHGRERGGPPVRHPHPPPNHAPSSFQSPSGQPPTLSQAPSIAEGRSHHSSTYVTAGKPHPHPYNPPHGHSPRPGSVNPTFRRDAPPTSSSSMLRSMSADDLRRRGPPHGHERPVFDREHLERLPHSMEYAVAHTPSSGLILHQVPPGAVPHFTSAGGFARLPPSVMSVTPLSVEHSKGKIGDENKHAIEMKNYYERERILPPHEHEKLMRAEQERMLQMRDRALLERGGRPGMVPGPPGNSERMLHEVPPPPGEMWNLYKCKVCGQNFNQKHALEKHHCVTEASRPYECGRCELSFHDPHDLQEHMVMHNSDRPFRCGHCARSFQSSAALKSHMRMHENVSNPAFTPKDHSSGKGVG